MEQRTIREGAMGRGCGTGSRKRTVVSMGVTLALAVAMTIVPGISNAAPPTGAASVPPPGGQISQGTGRSGGSPGAASGSEGVGKVPPLGVQPPKGSSPAPPGGTFTVAPALTAKPATILLNPAVLGGITQALLHTDTKPAAAELEAALKETTGRLHAVQQDLWYYQDHARKCSKKTFTTEDQKAAGCAGTDTLNQCSVKLFQYCFSHNQNSPTQDFTRNRQKMLEASDRLDKALKEYTSKLKLIPEIKAAK
jgi:hypothetical protein